MAKREVKADRKALPKEAETSLPEVNFEEAACYVLKKNAELYRRLV